MNIKTKLILGIGMLVRNDYFAGNTFSCESSNSDSDRTPMNPAATPGLERALLWISVTGGNLYLDRTDIALLVAPYYQ